MIQKIFVRTDTSISPSWANSLEALNTYYNGTLDGLGRPDVTKIVDYEQVGNTYVRIDNKMRLFKNRNTSDKNFLALGVPTPLENQTVAHKSIDFDLIIENLKTGKYDSVQFGFIFNDKESVNESKVVEKSIAFARNKETKLFENVETKEPVSDDNLIQMAIWFTVYKMGDTEIYYMVTNGNLLMVHEDLSGEKDNREFYIINSHDGNFKSSVFLPSFSDGTVTIGENTIIAKNKKFFIDTLGNSFIHGFSGTKLTELPQIVLQVESSMNYYINNNLIEIDMEDKQIGYIKYRWVTNTPLDYSNVGQEALIYNYVVVAI